MSNISRRGFLQGCSAAIAAMSGARMHSAVFGSPENEPNQQILVNIFLRGGMDVLSFLPPMGGSDRGFYESDRENIQIPTTSPLSIGSMAGPNGETPFMLHPSAGGLHNVFTGGNLAIVHATGMAENTRSHFEAMNFIETGTPGDGTTTSGWIARHMQSAPNLPTSILMPSVAIGSSAPRSFATSPEVVSMESVSGFSLNTHWRWNDAQRTALRRIYAANSSMVHVTGTQALNGSDLISLNTSSDYTPSAGVTYPENDSFANELQLVAQLIKLEVGLRMVTIDLGGWDTHDSQGDNGTGYFAGRIASLSNSLEAFFNDLNTSSRNAPINRTTVVVMSEFGRRLRQNADRGTDHGHGGAMMVMGGEVNGGLYGTWPGLDRDAGQLYDNADLAVTTDYRQVLSEILIRRHENPNLGTIFPGFTNYAPLGLVQGTDLTPVYDGRVPTAATLRQATTDSQSASKVAVAAGAGLAATAGLVALRNRGEA